MNRSILIVICDFLVLSAMSLSMGLAKPSGKGPGVAESIRPVTHTFLIEQLEKAIQQGKDAAGENRKLNEALAESNKLLDQLKTEGERKDSKMEKLESALSVAEDRMARRMAELEEARKKNESLSKTLAETEGALQTAAANLQKTGAELGSAKTDLAAAKSDLAATKQTLASKESSLRQTLLTLEEEKKALAYSRQKLSEQTKTLQDTEKTLAVQSAELARTMRMVDEKEAAIRRNEKQIAEKNAAIFQAELLAMQKKQELEDVRKQHIAVTAELEKKNKDLQDSESKRSFTEGRLARANEEIDELKRQAGTRESKLREAESALQQNRTLVTTLKGKITEEVQKQAVLRTELFATQETAKKQEQEIRRQEKTIQEKESALAVSETKLKTQGDVLQKTAAELEKANKILRNDVLTSYANAVLPLHFSIQNDRLLKAFDLQEDFYLPSVKLSDKVFLPAALESVTGLTVQKGGYTTIADVGYTLKNGGKLAGPLYALAEDNRIVLIPVPDDAAKKVTPLTVITAERLRRRGLKDLTLFKAGKFGEQSASLDGRCSMRPDQDRFLIVRNSLRNSSEVPAEVGDFLMTKEGSFAGIVVRVVPYSAEGRADAWCWIFQPSIDLSKATVVPLNKKPDEKHFVSFASVLSELHKKITVQNRAPAE